MKKMLFTLAAVGTLAVPGGMAIAQDDTPTPTDPVTTCEPERDRDRDRDRIHVEDEATVHERAQLRLRLQDGTCDGECTGDQIQARDQVRLEDGTGQGGQEGQAGTGMREHRQGQG